MTLQPVVCRLLSLVKDLSQEVQTLRNSNVQLSAEVNNLKAVVSTLGSSLSTPVGTHVNASKPCVDMDSAVPTAPVKTYADVTRGVNHFNDCEPILTSDSMDSDEAFITVESKRKKRNFRSVKQATAVPLVIKPAGSGPSGSHLSEPAGTSSSTLIKKTCELVEKPSKDKRPARRLISAIGVSGSLKVAPIQKSLFLSRMDPTASVVDIEAYLNDASIKPSQCHKLRTKFSTYASFYIKVCGDDYEKISDPEFWPNGCIFGRFKGNPHPEQILPEPKVTAPTVTLVSATTVELPESPPSEPSYD